MVAWCVRCLEDSSRLVILDADLPGCAPKKKRFVVDQPSVPRTGVLGRDMEGCLLETGRDIPSPRHFTQIDRDSDPIFSRKPIDSADSESVGAGSVDEVSADQNLIVRHDEKIMEDEDVRGLMYPACPTKVLMRKGTELVTFQTLMVSKRVPAMDLPPSGDKRHCPNSVPGTRSSEMAVPESEPRIVATPPFHETKRVPSKERATWSPS